MCDYVNIPIIRKVVAFYSCLIIFKICHISISCLYRICAFYETASVHQKYVLLGSMDLMLNIGISVLLILRTIFCHCHGCYS